MALLNTKNHKSGFTLIEIMMVMVILGLLATVIIVIGR
ncbi:MAG: type II secretion system protein GspG, partial [Candidatus Portnoybacteria bacterium CG10_big_fil_rev_8_21_14_0_10_40_22]